MSVGERPGIELGAALEVRQGLTAAVEIEERDREVLVRAGVVRLLVENLLVGAGRVGVEALLHEGVPEVVVGEGALGVGPERPPVCLDRFVQPSSFFETDADVDVGRGEIGIERRQFSPARQISMRVRIQPARQEKSRDHDRDSEADAAGHCYPRGRAWRGRTS